MKLAPSPVVLLASACVLAACSSSGSAPSDLPTEPAADTPRADRPGDDAPRDDDPADRGDAGAPAGIARLALGSLFSCAILPTGPLKCWGENTRGQLGLGDARDRGVAPGEMGDALPAIDLGAGRSARDVALGLRFACALLDDATVKCWGQNDFGQLGLGIATTQIRGNAPGQMGDALPALKLGTGRTAKAITAGGSLACAILDDDTLKCWGIRRYLGQGQNDVSAWGDLPSEMGDGLPTVALGAGRKVKAVTGGGLHTCALLDDDSVKCWGDNREGQLGLGDTEPRGFEPGQMGDALPRVDLGKGRRAKAIVAGAFSTCALLDDDTVKCWGKLRGGVPTTSVGDSLPAVVFAGGRKPVTLALGSASTDFACARVDDASLQCWGSNDYGQLGLGTKADGAAPAAVPLGAGASVQEIAAGGGHACAALGDGRLKCWGRNMRGGLGLGDKDDRGDAPGEMGDALPAVKVAGP